MSFPVNVNFNVDKSHTVKNGTRNAIINHERRTHGYTKNPSIDNKLSKFNDYNNLLNYNNEIRRILLPYIKHHNNLKSVKQNPKRKIKSAKQLLYDRGKRIPYKYIVLKFGDGSTRKNLLQLFKKNGLSRADYANAINKTFHDYAIDYNATHKHLKFDHEDTNLDEVNRFGGDHAHLGCLANSKTKSGKQSLSFDRATKVEYSGNTNIAAWHIMQQKEANHFIHFANRSFQHYLGRDFSFKLTRNPHANHHLSHDKFIQIQEANDRLRKSNNQLQKALISSREEAEDLASSNVTVKDYNSLVDKANSTYIKLAKRLQNQSTDDTLNNLLAKLSDIDEWHIKEEQKLRKANESWYTDAMKDRRLLLHYQHLYNNQRRQIILLLGSVQSFNDSLKMPTEWLKRQFSGLLDMSTNELLKSKKKNG